MMMCDVCALGRFKSGRLLFLWSCGIRMKGWSEIPHVTGVNIT
jgi:hypothetical protein